MDEGAIISQQGIPIDQASDDQKVLDTRWVTLNIYTEQIYTNTISLTLQTGLSTNYLTVYRHNLGYVPAFDYVVSQTCSDSTATFGQDVVADNQNIYYIPNCSVNNPPATLTITIILRIYDLPITQSFQAPTVNTISSVNPTQSNYGVEFALPADVAPKISEFPVAEYAFSTRLKPLNILQYGTVTAVGGYISINYNYPNYPMYMLCQYYPNGYSRVGSLVKLGNPAVTSLGFSGGHGTINSTTITVSGTQSIFAGGYAYILLKDPIGLTQ
jgi:hypothetical protein